jgi:5-oxoprolinase (ATP-hydrolysing) subunit A
MIEGAEEAAARVLEMVEAGAVITASGKHLPTPIRSICVHGDSDQAVATASRVRERLEQAGIVLQPFRPMTT